MPISTCEHLETTEYTQHRFNTVWQLSCCDIPEINWVNKIWFSKLYKLANSLFFPFLSFICPTPPFAILNISQTLAWKICPVYTVNNLFHGTLDIQIYPILKKPWDWLFQWYKWNILTMAQLVQATLYILISVLWSCIVLQMSAASRKQSCFPYTKSC